LKVIEAKMSYRKAPSPKKSKNGDPNQGSTLAAQREIAKAGMVSSIGTLFFTGFVRFKGAGWLHTGAGWALLGFSIWHHILNTPKPKPDPPQAEN
jgi:hypothetical protein